MGPSCPKNISGAA